MSGELPPPPEVAARLAALELRVERLESGLREARQESQDRDALIADLAERLRALEERVGAMLAKPN